MKISMLMTAYGESAFYDEEFRIWYQSILPFLDKNATTTQTITPGIAYKYEGDFYGLLDEIGIDKKYHYYIMLYNGLSHSGDYDGIETNIKIPDLNKIEQLKNLYMSKGGYI